MPNLSDEDKLLNIDKIKKESLIDREADIYTVFEDKINELSSTKIEIEKNFELLAYLFCEECHYRDIQATHKNHNEEENNLIPFDTSPDMFYEKLYLDKIIISQASQTTQSNLKRLYNLNKTIFNYFWNITSQTLATTLNEKSEKNDTRYKVINQIKKEDLINSIGEDRALELTGLEDKYIPNQIDIQKILPQLQEEEKQQILYTISSEYRFQFNTKLKTYIMNNDEHISGSKHLSRTMFVEFDFSKPKKQLIRYLEYLIDEYNKEEKPIQNITDLLNNKEKYDEDMTNLLKTNKEIPLGVKLADVLYTYDCQYASYSLNEVLDELNGYHYEHYKIQNTTSRRSTVDNWSKVIKKYIDEKKYLEYYAQPINKMSESIDSKIAMAEEIYLVTKK